MKKHIPTPDYQRQRQILQDTIIEAAKGDDFPFTNSATIGEIVFFSGLIANRLRLRGYKLIKAAELEKMKQKNDAKC